MRFLLTFLVLAIAVSCTRKSKKTVTPEPQIQEVEFQKNNPEAKLYYQFGKSKEPWLAKSGDIIVTPEEIYKSKKYEIIYKKKMDILFVLFYKQFVAYAENPPKLVNFNGELVTGHFRQVLNQYGVPDREISVLFQTKPGNHLVEVDGKPINEDQVDKSSYLWGAYQTELFEARLQEIDRVLKNKRLVKEAKKQNMNVQDYREKYIFTHLKDNPEEAEKLRKKSLDYFMEKYLLDLPIQVNLEIPNFPTQMATDHVPTYGFPNSKVKIKVMADSASPISHQLMKKIGGLLRDYKGLYLEYRPILAENNPFQKTRARIEVCVFQKGPKKFWNFLVRTQNNYREKVHDELYKVIQSEGLNSKDIERCQVSPQTDEVIKYHKQYADYLHIKSGPVVFINGEVFAPPVDIQKVRQVVNRYLGVADAAVWESL